MKRNLIIFALLFSTVVAIAQKKPTPAQRERLEKKHGIRDIKLDTPKSLYNDLYQIKGYSGCGEMMQRENENLYIGNVKVREIQYIYLNNNLEAIIIEILDTETNTNSYQQLIDILISLYGHFSTTKVKEDVWDSKPYSFWKARTFTVSIGYEVGLGRIYFMKNDFDVKCKKQKN